MSNADYSKDSLAQLGAQLQHAIDVDGIPLKWVHDGIKKELVSRCGTKPIAEHLFQFHADAFRKNPSDEKFNELYSFMITLQAMDV